MENKGKIIIREMDGEDNLYELYIDSDSNTEAEISVDSDYLSPEDAYDIANDLAEDYDLDVEWEGTAPGWAANKNKRNTPQP